MNEKVVTSTVSKLTVSNQKVKNQSVSIESRKVNIFEWKSGEITTFEWKRNEVDSCESKNGKLEIILIQLKYWIFILETTITFLLLVISTLKCWNFFKVQWMNSAVFVICTMFAIKLLAIKIHRKHHALIFFQLITQDCSRTLKQ